MFKPSTTGKIFTAAVASDVILNNGRGTAKIAPGCFILSLLLLGLIASPFIWLFMKIFG